MTEPNESDVSGLVVVVGNQMKVMCLIWWGGNQMEVMCLVWCRGSCGETQPCFPCLLPDLCLSSDKADKVVFFLNFSSIKFQVIMQPVISVARRVEVSLSPQCYYIELGHQWSPKEGTHAKK